MKEEPFSYANLTNAAFLDELYRRFQEDPESVDPSWRSFFSGMEFVRAGESRGDGRVFALIEAYRKHGHKKVLLSPLKKGAVEVPELSTQGMDLQAEVPTYGFLEAERAPLLALIEKLEAIFCAGIGIEVARESKEVEEWTLTRLEEIRKSLTKKEALFAWQELLQAEVFEEFMHTKYQGQTRFSIEGGETLIPLLRFLVEKAGELGVEEIVLGMPHRGRLSVLAGIFGKSYSQIFREFEDGDEAEGSGDVKYHKGTHSSLLVKGKSIELSMAFNPSHLESVDPIIEGKARARQELRGDKKKVVPLLIHGDASLAGQGVVYETLQMSSLPGYETGGTIHIVMNNHIGYTTLPEEGRSTRYCTDIAKAFGFPVFHVSAENVEECLAVAILAVELRTRFGIDVFIDLGCYRKYGHNEGDEPSFTQPLEYKMIRGRKSIRALLEEKLIGEGVLTGDEAAKSAKEHKSRLESALVEALATPKVLQEKKGKSSLKAFPPKISQQELQLIIDKVSSVEEGFTLHPKLKRFLQERQKAKDVDWSRAEQLAFGSLLLNGVGIRLSGQDVCRGTFSQRHAVLVDQETGARYIPLNHISPKQAKAFFYNSPLSEFGVMGFDLGYSQTHPQFLVLWEAQYGDFANEAQVIIDQYLATSEQKWNESCNFTLLLPHGYEGKGPEHSSARMERFLQLAAEDNLIIACCSTPAQFFHLLRRQAFLERKRPLVVFTPKLLLRHPACLSSLEELVSSEFLECLVEEKFESAERLILCTGKVFYDLTEARGEKPVPILRVEQLYPFPAKKLFAALARFSRLKEILWVQEEPQNMGAWTYIRGRWEHPLPLRYVGREASASPATGSYKCHKKQLKSFLEEALGESPCK